MPEPHRLYESIRDRLTSDPADPSASSLATGGVVSNQLARDNDLPAIRLALLSDDQGQELRGAGTATARLQLDVYADRSDEETAHQIARLALSRLDRSRLTATGYDEVAVVATNRGTPFKEEPYYRVRQVYQLMGSL